MSGTGGVPLMSNARFRRLWVGQSISFIGDAVTLVALIVLVADLTGSPASVGGVLVARLIPTFASPFVGVLADRLRDRRRLLVGVDVVRAVIVFSLAFVGEVAVIYPLVFALGICQTLFNPTIRSAFPGVVGDGDITRANALVSGSFSFSVAVGPAVGGILVAFVGVQAAFALDALTFLVSAAFLAFVAMPSEREEDEEEGFFYEFRAGLSYLVGARLALALVVGALLLVLAENSTVPAEAFLARDVFGMGDAGYGLLVAAYGVGMISGSAMMAALGDRTNLVRAYFVSIVVACCALFAVGLAPVFLLVILAIALAGACNGVDNVTTDALLQKRVPEKLLGRVYSVLFLFRSFGEVSALAAGGFIIVAVGVQPSYLVAAGAMVVFGGVIFTIFNSSQQSDRQRKLPTLRDE